MSATTARPRHPDAHLTEDFTVDGATVTLSILTDEEPESPREWTNLGVMFCRHARYDLGDHQITHSTIERNWYDAEKVLAELVAEHDPRVVIPLYLLDHSGLSIRCGPPMPGTASPFIGDAQGWDTSFVGWIMDTAATREECGTPDDIDSEDLAEALRGEVETYDTYLRGAVCGWIVEDENGDHLDSCWGYYDGDDAYSDGKDSALHHAAELGPKHQLEEAYRQAAAAGHVESTTIPPDGTVASTEHGGAFVEARVFVTEANARRFLDQTTTT